MDHKTWLWKKKSSEKSIITTDKLDLSMRGNEEEVNYLFIFISDSGIYLHSMIRECLYDQITY